MTLPSIIGILVIPLSSGTKDLATFYPAAGEVRSIEGYLDSDWAGDPLDRKSTAGGAIMLGGCRVHSHSRGTVLEPPKVGGWAIKTNE